MHAVVLSFSSCQAHRAVGHPMFLRPLHLRDVCYRSTFEFWLHPDRYKTSFCERGDSCDRPICFFAHNEDELRPLPEGLNRAEPLNKSATKDASEASSSKAASSSQQQLLQSDEVLSARAAAGPAQSAAAPDRTELETTGMLRPMSTRQAAVQGLAAGGLPAPLHNQPTSQGVVVLNIPQQQQYIRPLVPPVAAHATSSQQTLVGCHSVQQGGPQGAIMVRPSAHQGVTVAVIPAGPSTWAAAQAGVSEYDDEPPTLEMLCAALSQTAVQHPTAPGVGQQVQLQHVAAYSIRQQQQQLVVLPQQPQLPLQQQQLQYSGHLLQQPQQMPLYMTAATSRQVLPSALVHPQQQVVQPVQVMGSQQLVVVSTPQQGTPDTINVGWAGAHFGF